MDLRMRCDRCELFGGFSRTQIVTSVVAKNRGKMKHVAAGVMMSICLALALVCPAGEQRLSLVLQSRGQVPAVALGNGRLFCGGVGSLHSCCDNQIANAFSHLNKTPFGSLHWLGYLPAMPFNTSITVYPRCVRRLVALSHPTPLFFLY
jgi:hypothetical protein